MVRKGEYLERAVVIPGSGGTLEGLYHRGEKAPPMLIVPDEHSMESPIIAELAWAVTRRGHPTLRFNYRGIGASSGSFGDETSALQDARDAAEHLRATTSQSMIAVLGIGFGATIASSLVLADENVELLIAIAPDVDALPVALCSTSKEVVLVAAHGEDPAVKTELSRYAKRFSHGRLALIPGADPTFIRGLVELGRVVADAVAPPGMMAL
jgi:uncharacterized protein